jgi:dihydroorotase
MQFLLKSVNVLDPRSTYYKKVVDIEFSNGKITKIDSHIEPQVDFKVIEGNELCIATGFIDMNAQSGEPHFSVAENMASLEKSAAKGGFTHVCHFPHENHFIENESDVFFLKSKNQGLVKVLPVGSITQKKNQKNMAELYDMYVSGAVAFTNGNDTGMDSDTLINALNYSKSFGGNMLIHAEKWTGKSRLIFIDDWVQGYSKRSRTYRNQRSSCFGSIYSNIPYAYKYFYSRKY